jgi:recombinational DNA repair protein (RecF pathway)
MSFARQIDEQRYREQTERHASMPGVTSPTFRCVACGRRSVMKGCKRTAAGSVCAACVKAREARKARRSAA